MVFFFLLKFFPFILLFKINQYQNLFESLPNQWIKHRIDSIQSMRNMLTCKRKDTKRNFINKNEYRCKLENGSIFDLLQKKFIELRRLVIIRQLCLYLENKIIEGALWAKLICFSQTDTFFKYQINLWIAQKSNFGMNVKMMKPRKNLVRLYKCLNQIQIINNLINFPN